MYRKQAIELMVKELDKAQERSPCFNSYHEGYAIIKEEFDELWDEIRKDPFVINAEKVRFEASHVAATAIRFLMDLHQGG